MTDSDADLVRLLGENGRNGFDAVFNAYAGKVYRYAQRIAVNQADAEELVQETFLTLWAKHRSVARSDSSLLPWLLATCRNHGNNLYRKNRRNETTVLDPDRAARSPAEELAVDDLQWVLSNSTRCHRSTKRSVGSA
ncbi:MAG: sigma-70 family RNA polymerase sigma factor [Galbitalea sp.]